MKKSGCGHPALQLMKQAGTGIFENIQDAFKAVGATVVGVWNFPGFDFAVEVGDVANFCPVIGFGGHGQKIALVEIVHDEEEVEAVKIFEADSPGGMANGDPALSRVFDHSGVGRISFMKIKGSGGIALDAVLQVGLRYLLLKDGFCRRRTADIAHADKEKTDGGGVRNGFQHDTASIKHLLLRGNE